MAADNTQVPSWASKDGHFRRQVSAFRDTVSSAPDARFPPAKDRYVLYVSYACPWAQRALIVRELKGLQDIVRVAVVHPFMGELGWSWSVPSEFDPDIDGVVPDPLFGATRIRDLYYRADENYSARFTVPFLFDSVNNTIVNNESSEIIRIFNSSFNALLPDDKAKIDLYPEALRTDIDDINSWIYDEINNGVYKSGFATTQEAYEQNVRTLFAALDRVERHLEDGKQYLIGDQLTEADVRLFTTIVRFDPVYVSHFKCNIGTIRGNYPNIDRWLRRLYWPNPAFKDTTNFTHIKYHYLRSHPNINPTRIVPVGPLPNILPLDA